MRNYISLVKHHVKEEYAVIIIDNSDIANLPAENWKHSLKYELADRHKNKSPAKQLKALFFRN